MAPSTGTVDGRPSGVRLAELVAVLSFASDFGLGQPMEHVLRSCLIALRLADRLGLDERERCETFWVTLLATVCTGESFELAQMFGDEVAFRSGIYHVGPSQLAQMVHALGLAGSNRSAAGPGAGGGRDPGEPGEDGRGQVSRALRADDARSRSGSAWIRASARPCRTPSCGGTARASRAASPSRACRGRSS